MAIRNSEITPSNEALSLLLLLLGAMDVTKRYEFIRFGAMDVTKPYELDLRVTKPHEFIGFGAMEVTKPYEFIGFGAMGAPRTHGSTMHGAQREAGPGGMGQLH